MATENDQKLKKDNPEEEELNIGGAIKNWIENVLSKSPFLKKVINWLVPIILISGSFYLTYWCWYKNLPLLLHAPKGETNGVAGFFILVAPVIAFISSFAIIGWLVDIEDISAKNIYESHLEKLKNEQRAFRERINNSDLDLIIDLVGYSRSELQTYYEMGLGQAKKSYNYSIVAMWLGFLIIVGGIVLYLVPLPYVNNNFLSGNVQVLTVVSGLIVEMIGALFFFMYRNSTNQLIYLYNRQRVMFDSVICLQICREMENKDDVYRLIIENILDYSNAKTVKAISPIKSSKKLPTVVTKASTT
jgi:hypothetical protein